MTLPAAAFSVAILLTGCGLGTAATSTEGNSLVSISGIAHGGPNPIMNGHVTLWETQSNGYGGNGKSLATTSTDGYGGFSFNNVNNPYTCDSGQFAYLTVTGGNTGANAANPNSIQMVAIGDCANLSTQSKQSAIRVFVSEVSTVAAAAALNNFMTVLPNASAGSGQQLVEISAPANNNSTSPGCSGTGVGTNGMTCTAAGLAHAFKNAANLVDAVNTSSTMPTGSAFFTPSANSNGYAPQAVLNTLGNIQQACVNSTGGAATSSTNNDGSNCGKLFSYTTVPGSSTPPSDTLTAMMNLVRYPGQNVTNLYGLTSPNSFFLPALTTAPTDLSVSIAWTGVTAGGTTSTFTYPYCLALDASDNVYSANDTASGAGPLSITGIASNGAAVFSGATGYSSSSYVNPITCATDTTGHFWVTNNSTTLAKSVLLGFSTSTGALYDLSAAQVKSAYALAVDASNNVFIGTNVVGTASAMDIEEFAAGTSASTSTTTIPNLTNVVNVVKAAPNGIAFDAKQNLVVAEYISGANDQYIGYIAAPVTSSSTVVETDIASQKSAYNIVIDSSNNEWMNTSTQLVEYALGGTTVSTALATVTGPDNGTAGTATSARTTAIDGKGIIYLPEFNSQNSKLFVYYPSTATFVYLQPCYITTSGGTTCRAGTTGTTGPQVYNPRNVQVDSSGAVWIASSTDGALNQVLGVGYPTWPQMSYLHPGVMPQ